MDNAKGARFESCACDLFTDCASSESIVLCTISGEAISKGDKKQQIMQSLASVVADIGRHDGGINVQKPLKTNDTDAVSATR